MTNQLNSTTDGFKSLFNNSSNNMQNQLNSLQMPRSNRNSKAMGDLANMMNTESNKNSQFTDTSGVQSLLDSFNMSPDMSKGFSYAKSQFSFQQSTTEYMETDNGFQYYQKDISIEITNEKFQSGSLSEDDLNSLTDYFSPENTAGRISNLATSFFPAYAEQNDLEDTPENREAFVDFITPSIDKGYEQALGDIGEMPDDVAAELQKTMDIVNQTLGDFAKGEPVGYNDKINALIDEQFKTADTNQDGLLNIEESGLSQERFTQLDKDEDGLVSTDEIASLISDLDPTKDLDEDLVMSILDPNASPEEVAQQAKNMLGPNNSISLETLSINIVVSETIIEYSQEPGEADMRDTFAKYLDKDDEAQEQVNNDPASIKDHLLKYKTESVMTQLDSLKESLNDFTEDFFNNNPEKLDFMFENPQMADFFGNNQESAENFIK